MADETKSFPQLPSSVWWKIRGQFKKTVPGTVTESFLATLLSVKPAAAKAYRSELLKLGIVDEKGKPTDLVYELRDDSKYADAAAKILSDVYPDELVQIAPPPNPDRQSVISWFMNAAKLGEGSAKNRASFYCLLASGQLETADPVKPARATPKKDSSSPVTKAKVDKTNPASGAKSTLNPSIQLNVEIHISSDATTDQIDAIFASMAKHLQPKA